MRNVFIFLIFCLVFIFGGIFAQIYLSKKESKLLGLILPAICLLISLLAVGGVALFSASKSTTEHNVMSNSEVVEINPTIVNSSGNPEIVSTVITVIYVFILYNIPTIVLLLIYSSCRQSLKKNKEIDKMNIQDLM